MQELRRRDLRQPDGGDVACLLVEDLAHLLIHALRLDRHVVKMGFAQQRALALTALFQPRTTVLELAGRFPFARRLHEQTERGPGVRHTTAIGAENPADLGWPSGCRYPGRNRTPALSHCHSGGWSADRPSRPSADDHPESCPTPSTWG